MVCDVVSSNKRIDRVIMWKTPAPLEGWRETDRVSNKLYLNN